MKMENGKKFAPVGHKHWVIPEGWIPKNSHGSQPEMLSHEAACPLNVSDEEAHLEITVFYSDRDSVKPA
jgi:hypothetical protein